MWKICHKVETGKCVLAFRHETNHGACKALIVIFISQSVRRKQTIAYRRCKRENWSYEINTVVEKRQTNILNVVIVKLSAKRCYLVYNIEYSIKLCISVSLHEKYHNCTQKVHEINTTGLHKTRDKVLRQQLHGEPLKTTPSCIYCYAYIRSTGTKIHTRTHIKHRFTQNHISMDAKHNR